ncbi:hypothetical protein PBRA_007661, partial [Plasmodiophora brassicae]
GLLASGAGSIDPTPAGVVYVLHADARDRVRQRRLRARCTSGLVRIASYAWYALRVSFGVCLFLSIVIAAVIIIAVWIAKCTQDGADRDRFHHHHHGFDDFFPGFDRMAWWYLLQPPVFVPSPSRGHQYRRAGRPGPGDPPPPPGVDLEAGRHRNEDDMGLLLAIFSLLFGDGDPNRDWDDRRCHAIHALIQHHAGCIIAEQTAPYYDECLLDEAADRHEHHMLDLLARFDGEPIATDDGRLVFPVLMVTADDEDSALNAVTSPPILEREWRFSAAPVSRLQHAIGLGLGIVNIIEVVVMRRLLSSSIGGQLSGVFRHVGRLGQGLSTVMTVYACAYVAVPLIRYAIIQLLNMRIRRRNAKRTGAVARLLSALSKQQDKLNAARAHACAWTQV